MLSQRVVTKYSNRFSSFQKKENYKKGDKQEGDWKGFDGSPASLNDYSILYSGMHDSQLKMLNNGIIQETGHDIIRLNESISRFFEDFLNIGEQIDTAYIVSKPREEK